MPSDLPVSNHKISANQYVENCCFGQLCSEHTVAASRFGDTARARVEAH
jgi:hypothetical protein